MKASVQPKKKKKKTGSESQWACRQDELIDRKPPIIK
jgi:hypothetical protein